MNAAVQEVADALAGSAPLSSVRCRELSTQLGQALQTAEARWAAIRKKGHGRNPGRVRQEVLAAGSPEQLAELDRETGALEVGLERIQAQLRALADRRVQALDREAAESLPGRMKELAAALDELTAAESALRDKRSAVFGIINDIRNSRDRAGARAVDMPEDLVERATRAWASTHRHELPREALTRAPLPGPRSRLARVA